MRCLPLLSWVFFLFGPPYVASAQLVKSLDYSIHEEYLSTRALGMGNAFTAVADDFSAVFYNPAMLAWRKDGNLRLFVRAGATPQSLKLFNEINSVKKEDAADQPQGYTDLITRHYGDDFYYRVPTVGMVWARPNWGFAIIPVDLSLDASVHRQLGPMLNVNLFQDTTLALSYAHDLDWLPKGNRLSWGATAKSIYRIHVGKAVSAGELATGGSVFSTADADEGLTFDLDMGTSWKLPQSSHGFFKWFVPSFAFVGRNLVDYGFRPDLHLISKHSGAPPNLQRRFDVGTKWELPRWWVFDPRFAFDVRDMGDDEWTFKKGYHLGLEFYWKMRSWWKGYWSIGDNQGYLTAGFGAKLAFFQLDLATYGEEVGTASAPEQSRRYMLELALDF